MTSPEKSTATRVMIDTLVQAPSWRFAILNLPGAAD
jgi:hypothetical protein